MNVAYEAGDLPQLRDEWVPHLNDYHLFDDMAIAERFRDETTARVPSHAPFFVYALYFIPTASRGELGMEERAGAEARAQETFTIRLASAGGDEGKRRQCVATFREDLARYEEQFTRCIALCK